MSRSSALAMLKRVEFLARPPLKAMRLRPGRPSATKRLRCSASTGGQRRKLSRFVAVHCGQ